MDIQTLTGAARSFLRRVRGANEPLHAEPFELPSAESCLRVGYVRRVPGRLGAFEITPEGADYLDRLLRAH